MDQYFIDVTRLWPQVQSIPMNPDDDKRSWMLGCAYDHGSAYMEHLHAAFVHVHTSGLAAVSYIHPISVRWGWDPDICRGLNRARHPAWQFGKGSFVHNTPFIHLLFFSGFNFKVWWQLYIYFFISWLCKRIILFFNKSILIILKYSVCVKYNINSFKS